MVLRMSRGKAILVVEDEADLAELLQYNLEGEGYHCRRVGDGDSALAEVRRQPPDLIVLDRMLPGRSGDEVASQLRRDPHSAAVPIIMMSQDLKANARSEYYRLGATSVVETRRDASRLIDEIADVVCFVAMLEGWIPKQSRYFPGDQDPVPLNAGEILQVYL